MLKDYSVVSHSSELLARVELRYDEVEGWVVYELYTDWYDTGYDTSIEFKDTNRWTYDNYEDAISKFEYCKRCLRDLYR
jgi:hypothetical protein